MSLFAKLSSSSKSAGSSPVVISVAPSKGGVWVASLTRHDSPGDLVQLSGPCPLSSVQVAKGCVCEVSVGSRKFLINVTQDSYRRSNVPTLSISAKLYESLQLAKDAKEAVIDDLSRDPNLVMLTHALTDLVISIKDRYVSKRELWMFQIRLLGSVVYRSIPPPYESMLECSAVCVESISTAVENSVDFGIVGPQTKIVIRSNSAQICLLANITRELWTFDPVTHEPLFKKFIQVLTDGLAVSETKHHHLLLLLSTRLVTEDDSNSTDVIELIHDGPISKLNVCEIGKKLSKFFNQYPSRAGWVSNAFYQSEPPIHQGVDWLVSSSSNSRVNLVRDSATCACVHEEGQIPSNSFPSSARDTNLLESINLAVSHFSKHHMDRKLHVTGTQISMVTANNGSLTVKNPTLFEISRRRIQASACGIRIVSVGPRPTVDTFRAVCLVNSVCHPMDWLTFHYFEGRSVTLQETEVMKAAPVDALYNLVLGKEHQGSFIPTSSGISVHRPSGMSSELESRKKLIPEPFKSSSGRKPKRTDSDIVQLSMAMPRLQRVAVEATIRPGDVKAIDNWIVQGEGQRTLHDLIGTRLSLDMQMVDISGTEPGGSGSGTPPEPMSKSNASGGHLSPRSEKAGSSSIISANAFGVKVHRASMRESHIQKVLLRAGEDRCMWMLNRLDSGNVYVSRVALIGTANKDDSELSDVTYKYILRIAGKKEKNPRAESIDIIQCKFCQQISQRASLETRRFFIPPPLPWNVLDEIISNPYAQHTLPSSLPLNLNPIQPEMEGFRWKLRSAIRTGLFCLVPVDESFAHAAASNVQLGQEVQVQSAQTDASNLTSRFLDWLRKTESLFGVKSLNVSVIGERQKHPPTGFVSTRINVDRNDWLKFFSDQFFQPPKIFIFSIEWILCHSARIDSIVRSLDTFAREDKFKLVRLPHSQLFPCPAPGGDSRDACEDTLPFHSSTGIKLPDWTKAGFYGLLMARLLDQLAFLLLLNSRDDSCPEGFSTAQNGTFFSRVPSWTLMSKDGSVLVEIRPDRVNWIRNSTHAWTQEQSSTDVGFLVFKQIIHTSLIDSNQ